MGYYRRKKRPSEYRFLKELYPSAIAILLLYILEVVGDIPCSLASLRLDPEACRTQMPSFITWGLVALFMFGIIAAGYRIYRDFYLGEYWTDLTE
jgi:hypothetical protein